MMTAIHDIQATELQKERYSRELAAYTLKQWDTARRSLELSRSQRDKSKSPSRRSETPSPDATRARASSRAADGSAHLPATAGVQSVDYARRSHKRTTNGVGHESRTVDPLA
ncbi:hypothetical protein EIP91_005062 [Steccherinum ochraceum]|uniref:Uncharacterized protein n=1 Tax=Steccherinum ochraceum TaxID=92696 RepID=A0A4R0RMS3_9APHY|nr:hypothetical protein EIP91_005062 [Steccherinum ochraceum]